MSIGLNVHGHNVANRAALAQHLSRTKPRWLLVLDNLDLAKDIKQSCPATNVIFRAWPDEALHTRFTPQQWVSQKLAERGDLWFHTHNEPGFSDAVLDWTAQVIELAASGGLKVVVLNLSAGTPAPEDWKRPAARRVLEALDKHRATAVLGLHEYFGGVVTSGFVGGFPTRIQPADWPPSVADITCWHCGRFRLLMSACADMGIQPPRIVLTEHGADDMSDIKAWLDTLQKTPPHGSIRGWRTLEAQWRAWWTGWTADRAYFEQLAYADRVIYAGSPVEAQLVFCYGASSADWQQFNIETSGELLTRLEEYAKSELPPEPPPKPPAPGAYILRRPPGRSNVRAAPKLGDNILSEVGDGDEITVGEDKPVMADGYTWLPVTTRIVFGWLALLDGMRFEPVPTAPPAPNSDLTRDDVQLLINHYQRQAAEMQRMAQFWMDVGNRLKSA